MFKDDQREMNKDITLSINSHLSLCVDVCVVFCLEPRGNVGRGEG